MVLKVLYFTCVDIDVDTNGGAICCRNHIKRLSKDEKIQLFVMIVGPREKERATLLYLETLGVSGKYVAYLDSRQQSCRSKKLLGLNILQKYFPLFWEDVAARQNHVDQAIIEEIARIKIDVLFIDYLYSAMFCQKAIDAAPASVLMTLKREAEFYHDYLQRMEESYLKKMIKVKRMQLKERYIISKMNKVIALSPPDMPVHKSTYITPYLDKKQSQWRPNNSRAIFFVGNYQHYPNLEAIKFIITKLAPEVVKILPDVRFKIIGAAPEDIPFAHHSVDLLGKSNADEVEQYFLNCHLFICPIKNTFGLKFKIAEALSYGTPFVASFESMLCVPHLKNFPIIALNNAEAAARTIVEIIKDEKGAAALAKTITAKQDEFITSQENIWSKTLTMSKVV